MAVLEIGPAPWDEECVQVGRGDIVEMRAGRLVGLTVKPIPEG